MNTITNAIPQSKNPAASFYGNWARKAILARLAQKKAQSLYKGWLADKYFSDYFSYKEFLLDPTHDMRRFKEGTDRYHA